MGWIVILLSFFTTMSIGAKAARVPKSVPNVSAKTADTSQKSVRKPTQKQVDAIMAAMVKTYRSAASFEEQSVHIMEQDFGGSKNRRRVEVQFAYQKPNKFLYKVSEPYQGVTVVSNGRTLWIYSIFFKQYVVKDPPQNMEGAPAVLRDWGRTYMDSFAFMQGDTPYRDVKDYRMVGSSRVGDVPVHVIELRGTPREMTLPRGTTRLYIGKSDHLLYKTETRAHWISPPAGPGDKAMPMKIFMSKSHSSMKVNRPVSASLFAFKPPDNSKKVNDFSADQ